MAYNDYGDSPLSDTVCTEEVEAHPEFVLPSAGYVGWLYTPTHNGLDIWTSEPDSAPCGNPVRVAYGGTIFKIKKTTAYTDAPQKGDPQASIVVLRHEGVPGLPDPFYTWYLHMARDDGTGTCITEEVWDNLGQEVPAGFPLGYQGNMRLAGNVITHLHFMVSNDGNDDDVTYDPSPFLLLNVCQGRTNCQQQTEAPQSQQGNGLLYSSQTIAMTLNTNNEEDSVYFYGTQNQLATIHMNKLDSNSSLDSYLILYAPDYSEVARDDNSGGDNNALINRATLLQNGYYRIVAKSNASNSKGSYSLGLRLDQ